MNTTKTLTPEQMTATKYVYILRVLFSSFVLANRLALLHVVQKAKKYSPAKLWHAYLVTLDEPGEEISTLPTMTTVKVMAGAIAMALACSINF